MAIKDFDKERAKRPREQVGFAIGGKTFKGVTAVAPEIITLLATVVDDADAVEKADDVVLGCLPEAEHEAWREVRAVRGDDTITLDDLLEVVRYLVEAHTARPTESP